MEVGLPGFAVTTWELRGAKRKGSTFSREIPRKRIQIPIRPGKRRQQYIADRATAPQIEFRSSFEPLWAATPTASPTRRLNRTFDEVFALITTARKSGELTSRAQRAANQTGLPQSPHASSVEPIHSGRGPLATDQPEQHPTPHCCLVSIEAAWGEPRLTENSNAT